MRLFLAPPFRLLVGLLTGWLLILPGSCVFGQEISGFWLGVAALDDSLSQIFSYTTTFTQTNTTIGGTAQTANPTLPFGGLATVSGQVVNGQLTFQEANMGGTRNDRNVCYWSTTLTYDPATESLKGTFTNIVNPPYCSQAGGGKMELYRLRLKSGTSYCKNTPVTLEVTGLDIHWYDSPRKTRLLATSNTYSASFSQPTTLYVTQTVYNTESPAVPLAINVGDPQITDVRVSAESCGKRAIAVTATGGQALQYSLNGGPLQPNPTFGGLGSGSYTVTVKDPGGCQTTRNGIDLPPVGPLRFDKVTVEPPKCGASTGQITVVASGGLGQLAFSLDGSRFQGLGTVAANPGSYTVTLKDEGFCTQTQAVTLTGPVALPVLTNVQTTPTTCGQANGGLSLEVVNGRQPLVFSVDGKTYQASPLFTGLKAATYATTVRDADGCTATKSVSIAASNGPLVERVAVRPTTCATDDGALTLYASGTAPLAYALDGGAFQPSPHFSGKAAGAYTVTVRDGAGCLTTAEALLNADCRQGVYLPTAFSPNGDGLNETLTAYFPFPSLTVEDFTVFNRWGGVVFHRAAFTIQSGESLWDALGLANRSGVYAYTLAVEFPSGERYTYRGAVTVVE